MGIVLLILVFNYLFSCQYAAFLGGTISWFHYHNKLRFVYRLTWEYGTGPCGSSCSVGSMGTVPNNLQHLQWNCTDGCGNTNNTELNDVNYIITTFSNSTPGYEQGEDYFFPSIYPKEVTLDGLVWGHGLPGMGRLVTTVNLDIRNDTNLPNASPIAAPPPYIGVQFGCMTVFQLPIQDPDEDTMICRFANESECGDACNSIKSLIIYPETCTILINATTDNGYKPDVFYRVAVTVEDFPDYTIKVGNKLHTNEEPFSSVPLQFYFRTMAVATACGSTNFKIALPTVHSGYRIPYPSKSQKYKQAVYIETAEKNLTSFILSNPAKMKYEQLEDDQHRQNVTRIYESWGSVDNNQYADSLSCSWALNVTSGLTSKGHCLIPMIYDTNECYSLPPPCKMKGTCIDLWHRIMCRCPYGYKRPDCSLKITCADSPCRGKQVCVEEGGVYKCYIPVSSSSSSVVPIVVGTLAALLAAAATSASCWYFLAGPGSSNRKKKDNQVTPEKNDEDESSEKASQADKESVADETERPKTARSSDMQIKVDDMDTK